jgi:hypothetical protein
MRMDRSNPWWALYLLLATGCESRTALHDAPSTQSSNRGAGGVVSWDGGAGGQVLYAASAGGQVPYGGVGTGGQVPRSGSTGGRTSLVGGGGTGGQVPDVADTDADTRDEGSSDGGLAHDSDVAHVAEVGIPMLKLLAGGLDGPEDVDGTGAAARFYAPEGVASDGAGNLFVADTGNRTIRKVVIATGAVTTLAGFAGSQGSADGMGAVARFSTPGGVASDGVGNLFVADSWNHTIRKVVIATGAVTTLAGSAGNYGEADGTGAAALFYAPAGVVSDGAGNLFVADSERRRGQSLRRGLNGWQDTKGRHCHRSCHHARRVMEACGAVPTERGLPRSSTNRLA